ncbi:hypothetical protein AV540_26415 [Brevibacillus parabrevis]|uniref:hypothetical protein n=1 Tax=Brevibacillus parabrevis TaxID=54914 RepID=UPI0007AB8F88|nr:hypothetical protein [Brevibacillus parabrevis]KZE54190.1 hypothetical protein AV540_26415 [Brevibacillus parabrevis]
MQKKKHILVVSSLTTALLFNVLTPVMASGVNPSIDREPLNESLYKLEKSIDADNEAELAEKVFNSLSPEAQQEFLEFMVEQSEAGDTRLMDYHEQVIGKVEIANNKKGKNVTKRVAAVKAANPLDILSTKLDKLNLPRPVYYSFMAVGGGIAAAAADGPLPIGDIIGVLVAVGAGAVVGYYWEDIEPKFDKIVAAFEASFSAMADEIVEAFDYLYAKGIIYYHNIPKRLLNDAGDGVDSLKPLNWI